MLLLKNHPFLLLFLGRLVTNIGDSLYYVGAMWLVYDLGGSSFYTGLAGFLTLMPAGLQFLAGPLVDRWPPKKILVLTQFIQCLLLLLIPLLHYLDMLTVSWVLVVMPILAAIEQFAYPAQTKSLPLLLNKEELVKGNTLFSMSYQGVDMVFTALSGMLVAFLGAISLFLIDSFTFVLAALFFFFIRFPKVENREEHSSVFIERI